jgi:hypothetical protein
MPDFDGNEDSEKASIALCNARFNAGVLFFHSFGASGPPSRNLNPSAM